MNCPSCGTAIREGSVFCHRCGTRIGAKGGLELFKEFWEQLSIVGALIVFVGTQFSASSVTALIEGFINPSMNGEAGTKVLGIFVKTLPFTAAVAWITVRLVQEKLRHYNELAIVFGVGILLSYFISTRLSPAIAQVPLVRQRFSGPVGIILTSLESFYLAYGAVAFIQSIILGIFFGY